MQAGYLAQWLSWLERRPVTAEVVGSSPIWVGFDEGHRLMPMTLIFEKDLTAETGGTIINERI